MTPKLKALGLAIAAVTVLCAIAVASASAQTPGMITADGPVTLTGTQTPPPTEIGTPEEKTHTVWHNPTPGTGVLDHGFTTALGALACNGSIYTVHKYNATPNELLQNGATMATITPHYANCMVHIPLLGTRHVAVTMNGCDYAITSSETTGGVEGTYGGIADVVCPESKRVELHVYNVSTTTTVCTYKTNNQSLSGAHVRQTGNDIVLEGTIESIHAEHEGTLCGTGTENTAALDLDVTVKGYNAAGEETPISISH